MEKKNNNDVKTVSFIMVITLIGKIMGLVRDQFLASNYSIGIEANAFLTASRIPRVFFDVVFASAISASFIPVFNEYMKKYGREESFKLSNNFITLVGVFTTAVTILGILFAPQLTTLFADGFDEETALLCTKLVRILFPTTIFTGIAFSFVGILQSMDEFNVPAAMSIASNLVIIIYFIFFNDRFGIYGLTAAFLLGWAMQALVQIPPLVKKKFSYRPYINLKDEGLKKIISLMLPVMVSTWIQPINIAINTKYASRLLEGSGVSAIEYANTVYSIIVGVFVLSVANVIFPKLSRMNIDDNKSGFSATVGSTLEAMAFLLIPMTAGLMALSGPVISLIYEHGKFGDYAVGLTSNALFFFSIGMIGFGIQTILSRAYYAKQNGKVPLLSGVASIIINIFLCSVLSEPMGIGGLALASSVSTVVAGIILLLPTQKNDKIISRDNLKQYLKMAVSAIIMAGAVAVCRDMLTNIIGQSVISKIILVGIPTFIGILIYMVLTYILNVPQAKTAFGFGIKFLKGKGKND
ncbi:murein biosynthesis integral membrane protein MurJ [Anaerotignum faecicola]|nr:murein biosynthesis integral membrane protein MurJ [Anaerotignum faecicola]